MKRALLALTMVTAALGATPDYNRMRQVSRAIQNLPGYTVFDSIEFQMEGTQITLDGTVTSAAMRDEAVQTIGQLPGVLSVVNHLRVKQVEVSDGEIRQEIQQALHTLGIDGARVAVNRGFVTMSGAAPDEELKEKAAAAADRIPAVVLVTNNLQVTHSH